MTKYIEKQQARDLRTAGLTIIEIAKKLSVSKNTVNKWIKDIILSENDYYLLHSRQAKYKYNTELFKNPNAITYYLLGAFISDGCINKQSMRHAMITSADQDWLLSISNKLCPEKLPTKRKNTNCYDLEINNKQIVNWLITNECVPNKSLIVKMPYIPTEYFSHFVRGVFDGDGNISIIKQQSGTTHLLKTYIVSGSEVFVNKLSLTFNSLNIKNNIQIIDGYNKSIFGRPLKNYNNCYRITFNGSNAVKFCEFIYQNDNLHLERKYQKYINYQNIRCNELKTLTPRFKNKIIHNNT